MKRTTGLLCIILLVGLLVACSSNKDKSETSSITGNLVEVTALDFAFEMPGQIPSGWNTFVFNNEGKQEHFLYIYKLPENKTYDQFLEEAMVPFERVWNAYASGKITREEAGKRFGAELPAWFFTEIVPSGGPALTEPGETAQTSVQLEPGLYVVECYVKMPDGTWHTEKGMQQPLKVTEEKTDATPPTADVTLTLSNYKIESDRELTSGSNIVKVQVAENPKGFMQHDVNLFRLNNDVKMDEIVAWMDWMDLGQFRAPAPAYSLGGVEHIAAGKTAYMSVDLKPGKYAWISEGYAQRGMVKTFTVK